VLVTGCTASNDFPVSPGALQSVNGGSRDGFILKLNAGGSRVWCTYFGGTEYEGFNTITTDAANAVYLVGRTSSANYPVTSGVYQNSFHGYIDVAILKLSSGGACLISSFFGGSAIGGNSGGDEGFGILVDPSGCIYISGTTGSVDLPVVNALQPVYPAVYNAFAAKFDASLGTLLWSTFLGGSNGDNGNDGLARDASGDVCVVGSTRSYDFPIHAAWQPTYAGNSDAFVIWLNSDGQLPGYNAPPIAMAAATPSQGSVQLPVSFSSAGSYDPDGTITSYAWSFGDGGTSTDANPAHVYQTAGTYTATDDDNATASAAVTVTVSSANSFVYVFDQSVTRIPSGNKWKGQTVVTIYDDLDQPVSGALVTASYVGPNAGIVSGTTVANGSVTLQTAAKNNPSGTWCFTITDVQAAGYVFNGAIGEVTACETPPKLATDDNTPWTPELHVHPNPVRSAAVIEYSLPEAGTVSMRVYDILGRMIANAVDSPHPAGRHTVVFDASALPNGMYLCRMEANAQVRTALMIIAR
jgi:PKD repeat protein